MTHALPTDPSPPQNLVLAVEATTLAGIALLCVGIYWKATKVGRGLAWDFKQAPCLLGADARHQKGICIQSGKSWCCTLQTKFPCAPFHYAACRLLSAPECGAHRQPGVWRPVPDGHAAGLLWLCPAHRTVHSNKKAMVGSERKMREGLGPRLFLGK